MNKALPWDSELPETCNKPVDKSPPSRSETKITPVTRKKRELPPCVAFSAQLKNPPAKDPDLIEGLVTTVSKSSIVGDSKIGKSFFAIMLAVFLSVGMSLFEKFKCRKSKVLYVNLELKESQMYKRVKAVFDYFGLSEDLAGNLFFWNLRGYATSFDKLVEPIIELCLKLGIEVLILDPIYKVLTKTDENSASGENGVGEFCNELDEICTSAGISIIYVHHHSKKVYEKTIDRASGSGVFARDPDLIIDISSLTLTPELKAKFKENLENGEHPCVYSFVTRDMKTPPDLKGWFKYPIHKIDTTGLLENCAIAGTGTANLTQAGKSKAERAERLRKAYDESIVANKDGTGRLLMQIAKVAGSDERTIRRWVNENPDYEIRQGIVYRLSERPAPQQTEFPEDFFKHEDDDKDDVRALVTKKNLTKEEKERLSKAEMEEWKRIRAAQQGKNQA